MARIFLLLLGLCCSCATSLDLARFEESREEMGTRFRIVLFARDGVAAAKAFDAAWQRIHELDERLSDYDSSSELSRLSRRSDEGAPTECVPVSGDLWFVLTRSKEVSVASGGAFDVTLGPFVRLWRRAVRQERLPTETRLREAFEAVGHEFLVLHPEDRSVQLMRVGMRLDLGGIAKGYALDEALRSLAASGIESALIDGGGDLVASAAPPDRPGWRIQLQPRRGSESATVDGATTLLLANSAVATSGDSYRFVELEGVRYSHVIDPATGLGSSSGLAVTVLARDALTADACASAACVMGIERGIEWLESMDGVEARFWPEEKDFDGPCDTSGFTRRMASRSGR